MRLRKNNLSVLLFAWLVIPFSNGQAEAEPPLLPDHARYAIEHFGEHFGLGAATVNSLAQDQQGFLWIATQTGLYRYDGTEVQHFGRNEGLPGEFVDLVLVGADGQVWARTRKGIARLSQQRFTSLSLPKEAGAVRDVYQSFAIDSSGNVFVSTERGLVRIGSGKTTFQAYGTGDAVPSAPIDAIATRPNDGIWFASGAQLGYFSQGSPKAVIFSSLRLGGGDRVYALLPASNHKLWIRSFHNVGLIDTQKPGSAASWMGDGVPAANSMGGPSLDRHGNLLLPTDRGLYERAGNGWKVIEHRNGLISNAVASVVEDREGGIWIGTAGAGLDHWPGSKQWSGWTDAEGLPDALVLSVARDAQSRLWVGTNTALSFWDAQKRHWQTWTSDGLAGAGVRQLLRTPDGAVWALFPGKGLFRFEASVGSPRAERVPSTTEWQPQRIAAAPDGTVWGDGSDSLRTVRYENGHFSVKVQPVPEDVVGTTEFVSVSPGGVLWTAGAKGISRRADGQWRHFDTKDGLLPASVRNLRAVADNEVWAGYPDEDALTRFRISTAGQVVANQFPKAKCSLGGDAKKGVWLEMDEGAGLLSSSDILRVFTQGDGLLWNDLNCDAMWQESDGSVLLGTSKGLARYDPAQESQELPPPSVVLTAAMFGKADRLDQSNPGIGYDDRTFVAHFAAPIFHDPDHVSCSYRLLGLETEFTETTLREARYPSLPAGKYTFEVNCGSRAVGRSSMVSYPFSIRPPWWQTWWSELAALGLFGLFLWSVIQYHDRRDNKERARLEAAVAERSAELASANKELQEVSIRDPLTGIRNRRFFDTVVSADASQAVRAYRTDLAGYSRDHRDLIFYLIDVDHFKQVNDRYGHHAGDRLLVEVTRRLNKIVRDSDFLIRWGGEEFLVVCRSADREGAPCMAERILTAVGSTEFDLGSGCAIQRTCCVGWAPYPWLPPYRADLSIEEVLRLADHGLYLAKQRGRNQAVGILPRAHAEQSNRRYTKLEELMKDGVIWEVATPGPAAAVSLFQLEKGMAQKFF